MRPRIFIALMLMLMLLGCSKEEALLKDAVFLEVGKEANAWLVEGQATLRKAPEGAELISGPGAPFIYQQAQAKKRHKGGLLSLAAWVKTDVPASAYVEFSNRLGTDSRSEAHPGDGQWRLLKTTVRVPENSEILELRIRSYGQGALFVKEVSMTSGTVTAIEKNEAALDSPALYKSAGVGVLLTLMAFTILSFRNLNCNIGVRLLEVSLLLVFMSGIMLVAGRYINSAATANIACALFAVSTLVFLNSKTEFIRVIKTLNFSNVLLILSVLTALAAINALRDGAVGLAEKAARAAYFLMIGGAAAVLLHRLYKGVFAFKPQKRVRLHRKSERLIEAKEELPDGMN